MADPGSGPGGPDSASQAAGAAAESAASNASSSSGAVDTSEGAQGFTTGAPEITPAQFDALTPEQKAKLEGVPFERNIFGNPNFKSQTLAINNFISRYQKEKGPLGREEFNNLKGITATNPFGVDGMMTRTLGFDPTKVDYSDILGGGREGTVFNKKNALGEYVVKSGNAMQGIPAAQYNRLYGTPAQQIAANQYSKYINPENIAGAPGFNPAFGAGIAGYGLRPGVEYADYLTQYGPVMEQYREMSPTELGMRTLIGLTPMSFASALDTKEYGIPGRKGYGDFNPEKPRGAQSMLGNALKAAIPNAAASAKEAINDLGLTIFGPSQDLTKDTYDFYGDPNAVSSYPDLSSEQQLAGLFGENPKAAGFRDLQDNLKAVIGGEDLIDDQDMYGTGMHNLQDSYDLNNLDQLGAQGIGSFNVAADLTNMRDVGGGMFRSSRGKSTVDKVLEGLGFGAKSGPSGQIYSPSGNKPNMFQDIVSYFS